MVTCGTETKAPRRDLLINDTNPSRQDFRGRMCAIKNESSDNKSSPNQRAPKLLVTRRQNRLLLEVVLRESWSIFASSQSHLSIDYMIVLEYDIFWLICLCDTVEFQNE